MGRGKGVAASSSSSARLDPTILLFKGSIDEPPDETYSAAAVDAFGRRVVVVQIPVLAFERVANSRLTRAPVNAVIVTSARALWAVADCPDLASLLLLPWFVVGPSTAQACRDAGVRDIRGESSGSATDLFETCLKPHHQSSPSTTFLFLCGDIRRPTIPDSLRSVGASCDEVVVYKTVPLGDCAQSILPTAWSRAIMCFFSPSGVEAVRAWPSLPSEAWSQAKLVAIGPTTAASMPRADAVAASPTARALLEACAELWRVRAC